MCPLTNAVSYSCAIQSSQADMQRTMGDIQDIQAMLRAGLHRRNSTSSIASFAASINSKETWKQLCRDLHKAGVTADIIRERKDQIVNLFQGSGPPVAIEEILEAQSTESSTSLEDYVSDSPSIDAKTGKKKRNLSLKINWAPLNALTGPLLIAAAKSGDVNTVRLRLAVVGDIDYKDPAGNHRTALGWAAANGHREVVQLLLEKGANIEAAQSAGATSLYAAAGAGHLEVVKMLLDKGANIEAAQSAGARAAGVTSLYVAAWAGHLEVVKLLLEKGANIEAAQNAGARAAGATSLYVAAECGHLEVVELLLEKGANIEAAISAGATSLYVAAQCGQLEVVKMLLEKGANREVITIDGETMVDVAVRNGHKEVVKLLTALK